MNKPVWFLDVDGVINGDKVAPRYFPDWSHEIVHATDYEGVEQGFPIHYSPTLIEFINETSKIVDIVWLTTWKDQANTRLAPALGINGPFPEGFTLAEVDTDSSHYGGWGGMVTAKAHSVTILSKSKFAGSPVIWTDDQANKMVRANVKASLGDTPNLLMAPAPSVGINVYDMGRIQKFLNQNL